MMRAMTHGGLALLVTAFIVCSPAHGADEEDGADGNGDTSAYEGGISIGLSAAFTHLASGVEGAALGYEVTGSIRLLGIYWWASQGFLWLFDDDFEALFYYEAGVWLGVNLGLGFAIGGTRDPPVQWNLFIGLPIPIVGMDEPELFPGFFVEPYYRPSFHISGSDVLWDHEIGLILKLTTLEFEWPWADDGEADSETEADSEAD